MHPRGRRPQSVQARLEATRSDGASFFMVIRHARRTACEATMAAAAAARVSLIRDKN